MSSGLAFDTYGYIPDGLDANLRPVEINSPQPQCSSREQLRRCTCCDGRDGLGVYHVRGIEGLARMLRTTCPGPFAVEDHRGRILVSLADVPEARALVEDWTEARATQIQDVRADEGRR